MSITTQLTAIAKALGCNFTVKGQPIAMDKVFSETGLLPAILRRADQLCSFCLGYGLGLTFERSSTAMLGVKVQLDETVPNVLRLLCATDVLVEIMHHATSQTTTPLDELMLD